MPWDHRDRAYEIFGERALGLEIQVKSKLVQDIDVSNAGKRGCLVRACGVEVDEAILHIPRCNRSTVMPVVATVQ